MLETLFVPAPERGPRCLMVVLHGLGDSVEGYRWLPEAMDLPWMNYLLANAPDDYFGGYSWYDFAGDPAPGIERSRRLLFELLDLQHARGFATAMTTMFGFSQGCLMTVDVGFRYPRRFAGLVGISGYVHDPAGLLKELSPVAPQQRFLFTHGTLDPLVPCHNVRKQVHFLNAQGLPIEWREFDKPHTIAGDEELDVIREFVVRGYERQLMP